MGRKRTGTGKYFYICIAILICLLLSQCAAIDRSPLLQRLWPQDEARQHLVQAERLLAEGDYEAALEENQKVLSLSPDGPPADQALYNIGLIYAHPGNPKRDYVKSIAFLDRLIKDYAQSPQLEQAKVWVGVLRESEELRRELRRVAKVRAEQPPRAEPSQPSVLLQRLVAQGDYEAALEENQKVLSQSPDGGPPADQALYNIGLIYAHPGNPKRDYVKSVASFKRLIKEYPQSPRVERAKILVQLIQESDNAKRAAATLTQENDKLKRMIEESRKVDIQIEEKKKEQVR